MDHLSLISFCHIMTVRDVKIFLAESRDSSIDKQNENEKPLSNSTLSAFIKKLMNIRLTRPEWSCAENYDLLAIS